MTELGKALRMMRVCRQEKTRQMADRLGYTCSYLSAIETGARPVPEGMVSALVAAYSLDEDQYMYLRLLSQERLECAGLADVDRLSGLPVDIPAYLKGKLEGGEG